jgi:UrcA family protein
MLLKKSCALLAITLALSGAATARAETGGEISHEAVRFDDLDLASDSGARHLAARIEKAAKQVCAVPDTVFLNESECRREAIARAINTLARRQLASAAPNTLGGATKTAPGLAGEGADNRP